MRNKNKRSNEYLKDVYRLVVQGSEGPTVVFGRLGDEGTVKANGMHYPKEFLKPMGDGLHFLPTMFMMPADGDMSKSGDLGVYELVATPEVAWTAEWSTFWSARRRLVWSSIWQRGDGSSATLKNMSSAIVVVAMIAMLFQTWGLKGEVGRLSDTSAVLGAQVARMAPVRKVEAGSKTPDVNAVERRP
jgi:hypothetical protein